MAEKGAHIYITLPAAPGDGPIVVPDEPAEDAGDPTPGYLAEVLQLIPDVQVEHAERLVVQ